MKSFLGLQHPMEDHNHYDPATISLAMLGMSAISTVSGVVKGVSDSKNNAKIQDQQQQDFSKVRDFAMQMVGQVKKEQYDLMADQDIHKAMSTVSEMMSTRGLGLGSSAMASTMAGAAGDIRGQYGKAYLGDRADAQKTAMSALSGTAQAPRLGYNADPWGDFGAGVSSIGTWAAANRAGIGYDPQSGVKYPSMQRLP